MSEKISAVKKYPESMDSKTEEKYEKSSESETDLIDEIFKDAERDLDSFIREGDERLDEIELDVSPEIIESVRKETGATDSIFLLREKFKKLLAGLKGKLKKEEKEEKFVEKKSLKESESVSERYGFPIEREAIRTIRRLGGSSDVEMGVAGENVFFAVKRPRSETSSVSAEQFEDQLKEEYIADSIYDAMGFAVPPAKFYGHEKISHFISGKDLRAVGSEGYASISREDVIKEVQRGFVVDCLLANWDVIGMDEDNIRIGDDGKVYRIDNGGSLRFRARGELKGEVFGREVGELETMRKDSGIFGEISDGMIADQIRGILSRKKEILDVITNATRGIGYPDEKTEKLREIIQDRIGYLSEWKDAYAERSRGKYESAVTNGYFENWDDLVIEGNEGIKEKIYQNIINSEKDNEYRYRDLAAQLDTSIERVKEVLQERIERVVEQSNFFRATDVYAFEKIMLEDGRWKSQFETSSSGGCLSPRRRAEAEYNMFGFENDVEKDKEKRCIYGYFSSGQYGEINEEGKIPPPNSVDQYGRITFKIKKDIALKKATITSHDSLVSETKFPPTPAAKPHFTSIRFDYSDEVKRIENSKKKNWGHSYTEVQYHNGLSLDDVESIYISEKNGMSSKDVEKVKKVFAKYKKKYPRSTITLIEY